jgi:hypothetical protein
MKTRRINNVDQKFNVLIQGESCWPYLVDGRTYGAYSNKIPKINDFIVFKNLNKGLCSEPEYMVKRVASIHEDTIHVVGTVSWSKNYTIKKSAILGIVLARKIK